MDDLIERAFDAWEEGDCEESLALAQDALDQSPDDVDALRIAGASLIELGLSIDAVPLLERALKVEPDEVDTIARLGQAYFETLRFDQARKTLERAIQADPKLADAHYWLGHLEERTGNDVGAARRFKEAARLEPEAYPPAHKISSLDFQTLVEAAIAELPEDFRAALKNLAILVEPFPDDELLDGDPPLSPAILGVFTGAPLPERRDHGELPNTIHLFQNNIERAATSHEELIEEIRITLLHEIGHFLGLDEDEVDERGLR